jgi:hypothetical protein
MEPNTFVIDTKHVKHSTWYTRVTVCNEKKDIKEFSLRQLDGDRHRVYTPFGGTTFKDFDTRADALAFCQAT